MAEVRVMMEGELRFVAASGSGRTWATASAPASGIFAYVEAFKFTTGQTITTIKNRGIPDHHKVTEKDPIEIEFEFLWTGAHPAPASGSGATVPMWHLEFRASAQETFPGSGQYYQFHGCAFQSNDFSEEMEGDKNKFKVVALAMSGANVSGFLS